MFNTNDTSLENEDWFVPNEPDEVKLALSEDSEGSLYEDMLLLQSYSTEIDELTLEANEIETIIEKNDELGNIIKTADEELKKTGTISNETALTISNKYSEVSILLNINKEEINTESALKYKKEIYNLTKENSSDEHWLKRLLNKFIEFCRNVYYRVVEYATKLGIAITRQEVAATRLATYISDNLDNFKIDKWEYMIPYADIIGNFTILKNFTVSEIEKYVKFSNGGFESDRLVDLYKSCIDKKDLSKFKSLDGIPVEYDLREYLTDYKVNKIVPIDITGKTNHVLLSYIDGSNKIRLAKKTVYSKVDGNFKASLKTKGILSREDMLSVLRQISISIRNNRDNISLVYTYIREINGIVSKIKNSDDKEFISDVVHCGTILVNSLSLSSRVGLFSNGFIIGLIGKMSRIYKKQSKQKI